ncbi:MAG: tRNA (cytidine(34)-2'-O)-methyltransferase [Hyphomicrobiaceae bacterium hypho_1]
MLQSRQIIFASNGQPVLKDTDISVAEIVREVHEDGPDALQKGEVIAFKFKRDQLLSLLVYCAEQRCVEAELVCNGCSLHSHYAGIRSVDDWIKQYKRVIINKSGLIIDSIGDGTKYVASLDWLHNNWMGEDYWFWARRVLRKLRYGARQVDNLIRKDIDGNETPAIIVVEPQIPENVGMVARAMGNFGLDDLRVVKPRYKWPSEKARAVASGAASIIDNAKLYSNLSSSTSELNWVVATTARQRDLRKTIMTPQEAAYNLSVRVSRKEKCGILFGRERSGLETDEVARADAIVVIPVNSLFASLNLAQSVLLIGYEWIKAHGTGTLGRITTHERPVETGMNFGSSRPATKSELSGLVEHLESELNKNGFFNPPHRRRVVLRNIWTMLSRMNATDQEIRTMRGIVATLARNERSIETKQG